MNQNYTVNNVLADMHFTLVKPMEMRGRKNGFTSQSIQTVVSPVDNYLHVCMHVYVKLDTKSRVILQNGGENISYNSVGHLTLPSFHNCSERALGVYILYDEDNQEVFFKTLHTLHLCYSLCTNCDQKVR